MCKRAACELGRPAGTPDRALRLVDQFQELDRENKALTGKKRAVQARVAPNVGRPAQTRACWLARERLRLLPIHRHSRSPTGEPLPPLPALFNA